MGDPGETKPWEPPQLPDSDGGKTDGVRGEWKKIHPSPETPGSNRPMTKTERHHKARRQWRMRRRRRRRELAAQGTCQHTSPAQPQPQPRSMRARVVRTEKRQQRCRWEARTAHGMHGWGGTQTHPEAPRGPPEQRAPPAHGILLHGREGGTGTQPEGVGGAPPKQARTPFLCGLIKKMGGHPQDLQSPPPNAR